MAVSRSKRPAPPLNPAALERLALRYVERFQTTRAKLVRYLNEKVRGRGWDYQRPPDTTGLAERFAALGYIDDRAWAEAKAGAMTRRGLGGRRVNGALRQAGVEEEDAGAAGQVVADGRVAAALTLARRRQIGPFAKAPADRTEQEKQLATLVRGGHDFALARAIFDTADPASSGFRQAVLLTGQAGALYNAVAFLAAFAMVPLSRRIGPHYVHAVAVALSGAAMLAIPGTSDRTHLFLLMIGIGIGWASMMGNPYVMLANAIPPERTGVYMGIFNMFIVIPMLLETLIVPVIYRPLLGSDPRNILLMSGVMMIAAGAATLIVRNPRKN